MNAFAQLLLCIFVFSLSQASFASADAHGDEHEEQAIQLSDAQITQANIQLATVSPANIHSTLALYGIIQQNAENTQAITARFDGTIRNIHVQVGDKLKKGDTLATVESNSSLNNYALTASISGVVTQRHANNGEQTAGRTLFRISDLSDVWVEISVFSKDAAKIQLGQRVRVSSNGETAEAKIIYIAPFSNPINQSIAVRAQLENPNGFWRPGQFIQAEVILAEDEVALSIDNRAIQIIADSPTVFIKAADGFEARKVRLGRSDSQRSEILQGLELNQRYVAANSFILKSEMGKEDAEHGH